MVQSVEQTVGNGMRVLFALVERAGGELTIPPEECGPMEGAIWVSLDEDKGITVWIAKPKLDS